MRLWLSCILCLLLACAGEENDRFEPLDLTAYNIPVTIQAPATAAVQSRSLSGLIDDVIIKDSMSNYAVQVLASQATTSDRARMKSEQLELVRDNRYFERIVEEEPRGFIFENKIDTVSAYGFRYIVYQGDREIVFQNSFDGVFGLEEVRTMYGSVKGDEE